MGIFSFNVVDFLVLCSGFDLGVWGFLIWLCNFISCCLVLGFIFFVFNKFFVSLNFLFMYKNLKVILWVVVIFLSFWKYCFCFFRKILLEILSVDKSMMYCLFNELILFGFEKFLLMMLRRWGFESFYVNFFIEGWIWIFFFK